MFVIEGADHLGKTTFAKQIVAQAALDGKYPIRYCHMTRPNSCFNFRDDYWDIISKYAVQDRFHLGALMYHDPPALTLDAQQTVERWLSDVSSVVVVFYTSDDDWLLSSLKEHGKDEMFDAKTILGVNRKYREFVYGNRNSQRRISYCGIDIRDGQYPDITLVKNFLSIWYGQLDANPICRMRRNHAPSNS